MYKRVSRALRDKIEKDLQEVFDDDGNEVGLISFTSEERELYEECIEWKEYINTYLLSSYWGGSLKKFLHYNYIKPHKIFRFTVTFEYEINWNQSWKDWFIVDERKDYASILFA